jgi:hypothetical protein
MHSGLTILDYKKVEEIQNPSEASNILINGDLSVRYDHAPQPPHSIKSNREVPVSSDITSIDNWVSPAVDERGQNSPLAELYLEVPHSDLPSAFCSNQISVQQYHKWKPQY